MRHGGDPQGQASTIRLGKGDLFPTALSGHGWYLRHLGATRPGWAVSLQLSMELSEPWQMSEF